MATVCKYFRTARGCWYGDRCRFVHDRTCRFFNTESGCRFGASCRFIHSTGDAVAADKLADGSKDGVDTCGAGLTEVTGDAAVGGVEAAMASLSVLDPSLPVIAADDSVSAGASACPSTSALDLAPSAAAAAAAAKCGRKKKRAAKKGTKKMKQVSKSKELVLYDHQTVKCGECGLTFTSGATNTENWTALRSHYIEKLGRADQGHLQFIRRHDNQLTGDCFCGACGNLFTRPVDLFRHLAGKTRNNNEVDSAIHASFFEAVVLPFVERDAGFVTDENVMLNHLKLMLSGDYIGDSDFDSDDDSDDGLSMLAFMMLAQGMRHSTAACDSDVSDDDGGMFGFSSSDVEELLCQGIKPWDDCAPMALAVLRGDDDFF